MAEALYAFIVVFCLNGECHAQIEDQGITLEDCLSLMDETEVYPGWVECRQEAPLLRVALGD